MRHELRHVRAFLKVAELGSFTRAAAELHVSQSALTVQVKQLEDELGLMLLDRNKRGVTITAAGRDLLGPLRRLIVDTEAIIGHARDISAVKTGTIAVAALPSIAADLLPRAMRRFLHASPDVRITVHDVVADRVRELVAARTVDFGLGTASRRDRDIRATALYDDHLAAFVPAGHALAKQNAITLRELSECELILPNRESSVRRMVEVAAARSHTPITVRHETNFMPTALALVRRGLGISILPESAASANSEDIVRVPITKPLGRQISLLQRADRTLSPAAERLVQVIRNEISPRPKAR
jgi:DNA-binding transcriptional LysR family regulator